MENNLTKKGKVKVKKRNKMKQKEALTAYICLIPSFLGLIFITYLPLLMNFGLSFFSWNGFTAPSFVGFDNYDRLFTADPYFYDSIKVTIIYTLITVVGSLTYSMIIAILMTRKIPARGFFRAIFYVPYILPAAGVYIGWSWLYETNFGLFNYILNLFGIENVMFLSDSSFIVPSLSLIAIWLSGNLIIIFMAGLQNVSRVYYEAAMIDGANSWQVFWKVTIPIVSPIIFYNLLMAIITNMQVITPALSLTNGGPGNSSMFLCYLIYRYAFKSNQIGYACALSFLFFVVIGILTTILFRSSNRWVYYEGE